MDLAVDDAGPVPRRGTRSGLLQHSQREGERRGAALPQKGGELLPAQHLGDDEIDSDLGIRSEIQQSRHVRVPAA